LAFLVYLTISLFICSSLAKPHTSVPDALLYKHIDSDLPESLRARQLLIWCSERALSSCTFSTSSSQTTPRSQSRPQFHTDAKNGKTSKEKEGKGKDPLLAPLTDDQKALLRGVQKDIVRMLAEGKISTNIISHSHSQSGSMEDVLGGRGGVNGAGKGMAKEKVGMKENEQNVKNRAREVALGRSIEK